MNNYLCADDNNVLALSEIIQGNKPLLWKIDKSEKHWVYSKKIDTAILKEIYTAVCDFANDFVKYSKITDCKCKISGEDALSLYLSGIERLKILLRSDYIDSIPCIYNVSSSVLYST